MSGDFGGVGFARAVELEALLNVPGRKAIFTKARVLAKVRVLDAEAAQDHCTQQERQRDPRL